MDSPSPGIKAIVAIVDDNDAILDALQLLLVVSGWEARRYESGESFVEDMIENPPDCLILDSHLAGLSSTDVARAFSTRYPDIPIIGTTAQPGSELAKGVLSAGASVMLTKPVSAERIVGEVQAVVA
jgi:two-component system nitrogen regulation response regulator GlnG